METKSLLLAALRKIREDGPVKKHSGICFNLDRTLVSELRSLDKVDEAKWLFKSMCHHWPHFSGSSSFPIVDRKIVDCLHEDMSRQAAMQYDGAYRYGTMWDRRYRYGKLRWQLLDWAIEELMGEGDV